MLLAQAVWPRHKRQGQTGSTREGKKELLKEKMRQRRTRRSREGGGRPLSAGGIRKREDDVMKSVEKVKHFQHLSS